MRRVIAVVKWPRRIGSMLTLARYILSCLRDNPYFPNPRVALDTFEAHIAAAEAAQVTVLSGLHGSGSAGAAALQVVKNDVEALRVYVESVAQLDGTNGAAIVTSAGMLVKNARGPSRPDFAVKPGRVSGSVNLFARAAGRRASYEWQYASGGGPRPGEAGDAPSDEVVWTDVESTLVAQTTVSGLTPGIRYSFRCRTKTPKGVGDWSAVISLMVT
jgi:hypothetical protein